MPVSSVMIRCRGVCCGYHAGMIGEPPADEKAGMSDHDLAIPRRNCLCVRGKERRYGWIAIGTSWPNWHCLVCARPGRVCGYPPAGPGRCARSAVNRRIAHIPRRSTDRGSAFESCTRGAWGFAASSIISLEEIPRVVDLAVEIAKARLRSPSPKCISRRSRSIKTASSLRVAWIPSQ